MKNVVAITIALLIGLGLGAYFSGSGSDAQSSAPGSAVSRDEPLYWVAPMDPNFRRDSPGKSPMGMDLVPVYADSGSGEGEVRISPIVEHNLGVKTGMVRRGKLADSITTVGHVDYDEDRVHGIHPRVEGWVTRLHVKSAGETVSRNAALYDLYSPALVNAQEEFLSALAGGGESLVRSARSRLKAHNVSDSAIKSLEESGQVMQSVPFASPASGIVRSIDIVEGAFVSPGSRLMTIADLSSVWVTAEIFETDVARVEEGDEMRFETVFDPGQIQTASIDFVYPMLEAVTRTLQVRATVDNASGRLRPNMFTDMTIPLESEEPTLLVPKSAVIHTEDLDRVVMVTRSGGFKSVAVTVGRSGKSEVEVLAGLEEGDRVVTSAQFLIDSESSKSSDFQRIAAAPAMDHSKMDHGEMDHSKMDHGEMDHSKMDHGEMDHSQMDHGEMDHSKMDHGEMDHSQMDHGEMDHSKMDHGEMDHSKMDHGEMDHSKMDHGEMDHSQMDRGEMDHSKMNHGEMDHSKMDHGEMDHSKMNHGESSSNRDVWVEATIRSVNREAGTISLTHEPIPSWNWPTMTMMMNAGDAVDLDALTPGSRYRIHMMEAPDSATGYVVMHVEAADGDSNAQ